MLKPQLRIWLKYFGNKHLSEKHLPEITTALINKYL